MGFPSFVKRPKEAAFQEMLTRQIYLRIIKYINNTTGHCPPSKADFDQMKP